MKFFFAVFLSIGVAQTGSCQKTKVSENPSFSDKPTITPLSGGTINEVSGIADSRANPGFLWVHEDSGNPPNLLLVSHAGKLTKTIKLDGAVNRDWEELAIGPGPQAGKNYLFVGDIGDNNARYSNYTIYRFVEPSIDEDIITTYETIRFEYADGPRDCEAFFIDTESKDIYLVTKREGKGRVYRIAFPQKTGEMNKAEFVAEMPYSGVVAASVSASGKEILIKAYPAIYYYSRKTGETIKDVLGKKEIKLPYTVELQGEAVGFEAKGTGYFTLSEKSVGSTVNLFFYPRK